MFCGKCGKPIGTNDMFCGNCGNTTNSKKSVLENTNVHVGNSIVAKTVMTACILILHFIIWAYDMWRVSFDFFETPLKMIGNDVSYSDDIIAIGIILYIVLIIINLFTLYYAFYRQDAIKCALWSLGSIGVFVIYTAYIIIAANDGVELDIAIGGILTFAVSFIYSFAACSWTNN